MGQIPSGDDRLIGRFSFPQREFVDGLKDLKIGDSVTKFTGEEELMEHLVITDITNALIVCGDAEFSLFTGQCINNRTTNSVHIIPGKATRC